MKTALQTNVQSPLNAVSAKRSLTNKSPLPVESSADNPSVSQCSTASVADFVIEDLALTNVALAEHAADLEIDRDTYRELLQVTLNTLSDVIADRDRARAQLRELRKEYCAFRVRVVAETVDK